MTADTLPSRFALFLSSSRERRRGEPAAAETVVAHGCGSPDGVHQRPRVRAAEAARSRSRGWKRHGRRADSVLVRENGGALSENGRSPAAYCQRSENTSLGRGYLRYRLRVASFVCPHYLGRRRTPGSWSDVGRLNSRRSRMQARGSRFLSSYDGNASSLGGEELRLEAPRLATATPSPKGL